VHSEGKGEIVKPMLQHLNINIGSFFYIIADAGNKKGWDEAMEGIDYVFTYSTPLDGENHNDNDPKLIDTAKSGAMNIINTAMGKNGSTDQIFQMLLKGTPSPKVVYPIVDVRDLADLQILAMESPKANGERFIAKSEEMTMPQMEKFSVIIDKMEDTRL
jgi:hypothetical protein